MPDSSSLSPQSEDDNLLHTKAAALAWYRHGRRGSSAARAGRMHSFSSKAAVGGDASFIPPPPGPVVPQASRFKTEADKLDPSTMNAGQSLALLSLLPQQQITEKFFQRNRAKYAKLKNSPWDCGSSLYDSFELLCLSNQLGRCLTTVHAVTSTPLHLPATQYPRACKLPPACIHGTPYIPRSIQLPPLIPFTRSSKRSPLIHPFSSGALMPAPSPSPRPQQPPSHDTNQKSGFRKVFQNLLKTFHKAAPNWPSEKKPKPTLTPPKTPSGCKSATASEPRNLNRSEDSTPYGTKATCHREELKERQEEYVHHHHHSHHHYHHHFRNEGFRTISKPPKTSKWLQPASASGVQYPPSRVTLPKR